jgi:hypothetical protein
LSALLSREPDQPGCAAAVRGDQARSFFLPAREWFTERADLFWCV